MPTMTADEADKSVRNDEIDQAIAAMKLNLVRVWNRLDLPPPCTAERRRLVDALFGVRDAIERLDREREAAND